MKTVRDFVCEDAFSLPPPLLQAKNEGFLWHCCWRRGRRRRKVKCIMDGLKGLNSIIVSYGGMKLFILIFIGGNRKSLVLAFHTYINMHIESIVGGSKKSGWPNLFAISSRYTFTKTGMKNKFVRLTSILLFKLLLKCYNWWIVLL